MNKKIARRIQDYPRDENNRVSFSKIPEIMDIPNLLAVQLESFASFLQAEATPDKRKNQGLENVFRSVFPIESPKGK
jgi:DNA-directed RNA polymerase subunit beta